MNKKIEDKYKVLDQISHVLLRPQTYVGSNKKNTSLKGVIDNNKILSKEITYIPSFIKIFDEVITNSVDEHKRNKKLNQIDVIIDELSITIRDNGGIPVEIHKEHNQYVPEVIFGNLMSGSNYDDSDERVVAGLNGLGAKLTNIFSTEFEVSTCDGKKQFTQRFFNNMRDKDVPVVKRSKVNFTQIRYSPDFKQFGIDGIDVDHFKMIEKRVYDLAGTNPGIKFTFNKVPINFKSFEDYIRLYLDDFFIESDKLGNWVIGVAPSDSGFKQVSFVNSTETYDGGTHVDYILNQIIVKIREYFQKKHKVDVKPSEIKNHIFLFINSTVINPSFSSQTKEKLITEFKDFGYTFEVSDKLINSILKSEIVNSILDWVQRKKEADESKLARNLNKNLSKLKVDKLIDAKGKNRLGCSIGIFEGDSSTSSFRKYRSPETMGAFALKGKFINVSELNNSKLVQNVEAVNLMAAIGLKLGQSVNQKDLRYGKILLYVDSDVDGNSIAGLLINFFNKYWPELFEMNMIYKVETPIVVSINKKTKKKLLFYKQSDYFEWELKQKSISDWDIKYKKGLAALVDDEYKEIINNPNLTLITKDDLSDEYLDVWFGKSSDLRKKELI
jgi:DNA topoisomerase II